ncbi:MAG: ribonuclease P protein component [Candidatus Eremiobacteraeota bacterium]|nr:ribonuclease P protein component [Candidatus Eremiobacteraeota bacterium]
MRRFAALRRQADFARLRRQGQRLSTQSLTIYRSEPLSRDPGTLVGITVNKSVGGAVVRNRLRRRIAAIMQEALPSGSPMRLLVVVRPSAAERSFGDLRTEVTSALARA